MHPTVQAEVFAALEDKGVVPVPVLRRALQHVAGDNLTLAIAAESFTAHLPHEGTLELSQASGPRHRGRTQSPDFGSG